MQGGFRTTRLSDGSVIQAGLQSYSPIPEALFGNTMGWITRGVVTAVYFADEDKRSGWTENQQKAITCDVRTYGIRQRFLSRVPVLQLNHSLHDQDVYVPRAARQNIQVGNDPNQIVLITEGTTTTGASPTEAENMDGDHVLVGFMECDQEQPVVFPFTLPHPSSSYRPEAASGRVRRIRHAGVLVEFSEDGNLTIDATEAAKEEFGTSGVEVSNSGTGGIITIKTKDGDGDESQMQFLANGNVRIDDAGDGFLNLEKSGTATLSASFVNLTDTPNSFLVLGDQITSAFTSYTATIAAAGATHIPNTAGNAAYLATITTATASLASTISTWLSTKAKTG